MAVESSAIKRDGSGQVGKGDRVFRLTATTPSHGDVGRGKSSCAHGAEDESEESSGTHDDVGYEDRTKPDWRTGQKSLRLSASPWDSFYTQNKRSKLRDKVERARCSSHERRGHPEIETHGLSSSNIRLEMR